ncbi:MAG: FaeA/PapI family transcriptional regulator [Candidatus Helarchaeota archaeon]
MIEDKILEYIKEKEQVTRQELCEHFNLARTTAYDSLYRLSRKGLIKRYPLRQEGRGRPITLWTTIKNREWIASLQAYQNVSFKLAYEIAKTWENMFVFIHAFRGGLRHQNFKSSFFYRKLLSLFKEEAYVDNFLRDIAGDELEI